MMPKYLHIVSFNIPYPPNYGGVIDVFYKLKALHHCGIKIILHTFEYGRPHAEALNEYCEEIYYYKRNTGIKAQFSKLPYIVYSRKNKSLIKNLCKNDYPILFEGLHTCYYLTDKRIKDRLKVVRTHNIEHQYYKGLAHNSKSSRLKLYMHMEAIRLKYFEKCLKSANFILPLSSNEEIHFQKKYGKEKTVFLPLFHPHDTVNISDTFLPYVLYHGDLSTPENIQTALHLITRIAAKDQSIPWIIAGLNPDKRILIAAKKVNNVSIRANLSHDDLQKLIQEASVNVLLTNQVSGVKLKLLNALYNGHHCIVNEKMVAGSKLESLCTIVSGDREELLNKIKDYLPIPVSEEEIEQRRILLNKLYNNNEEARKLAGILFPPSK